MRFALQLTQAPDKAGWLDLARMAEDAGYDVVSAPDHLPGQFAPLVGLAAVAAVTSRVRLSTFVLAIGLRHLGMLAKEVATLDVLSDGRVEIGLGAGWAAGEYEAIGLPFPRPGRRIDELQEAAPLLRALWRGETVSADGAYHRLHQYSVEPRPTQPGGIPIVFGGGGPRMLGLAGREGDVVSIAPAGAATRVTMTELGDQFGWGPLHSQIALVRAAAAGRALAPELNLRVLGVTAGPDARRAAELLARERQTTPELVLDSPFLLVGSPQEMAEQIARIREETGVTYLTVSQRHHGDFVKAMEVYRASE
jgi:probable F420-dependent oxidoreductase